MDASVLTRVQDPVSSTNSQTVFHIDAEGDGMLRGDVMLHAAFTVTQGTNGARWRPALGGFAAINSIALYDSRGQTICNVREAARWAHFQLTRHSASTAADLDFQLSLVKRQIYLPYVASAAGIANAGFASSPDRGAVTANSATTATFSLPLAMLLDPLKQGMLPLSRMGGRLRLVINWETNVGKMFCALANDATASDATAPVVSYAQLSYTLLQSDQLFKSLPPTIDFNFQTPELASAPLANAAGVVQNLPLGLNNQKLSKLVLGAQNTATAYIHAINLTNLTLQILVNGRSWWPQAVGPASVLGETVAAVGELALPPGAHHQQIAFNGTNMSASDTVLHAAGTSTAAWTVVDCRTIKSAPEPSMANALSVDNAGVQLRLSTTNGFAGTLFAFGVAEKTMVIGPQGILQVV